MSKQLTLTLDNVSQCMSQLPAQITQHEIEGNGKEERKTEFGDFMYGFCTQYTFHIFHYNWIQNRRMRPGLASKCC